MKILLLVTTTFLALTQSAFSAQSVTILEKTREISRKLVNVGDCRKLMDLSEEHQREKFVYDEVYSITQQHYLVKHIEKQNSDLKKPLILEILIPHSIANETTLATLTISPGLENADEWINLKQDFTTIYNLEEAQLNSCIENRNAVINTNMVGH